MARRRDLNDAIRNHRDKPCAVPGCSKIHDRLSPFCRTHREHQRSFGHPTLKAQPLRVRNRTIRLVRENIGPFATEEVMTWVGVFQTALGNWSIKMPRAVDRQIAGYLADADPLEFLSATVAWVIHEGRREPGADPIPRWIGWFPKRRQRFLACQLSIYLRHSMAESPGVNSKHRRSCTRIASMLLSYRCSQTRMLSVVHRLATLVEPRVREELALEIREQRRKDDVRADAKKRELFPYGVEADGTITIYRAPKTRMDISPESSERAYRYLCGATSPRGPRLQLLPASFFFLSLPAALASLHASFAARVGGSKGHPPALEMASMCGRFGCMCGRMGSRPAQSRERPFISCDRHSTAW